MVPRSTYLVVQQRPLLLPYEISTPMQCSSLLPTLEIRLSCLQISSLTTDCETDCETEKIVLQVRTVLLYYSNQINTCNTELLLQVPPACLRAGGATTTTTTTTDTKRARANIFAYLRNCRTVASSTYSTGHLYEYWYDPKYTFITRNTTAGAGWSSYSYHGSRIYYFPVHCSFCSYSRRSVSCTATVVLAQTP